MPASYFVRAYTTADQPWNNGSGETAVAEVHDNAGDELQQGPTARHRGYIMYTADAGRFTNDVGDDQFVAVLHDSKLHQWFYSDGQEFQYFVPTANEILIASVEFGDAQTDAEIVALDSYVDQFAGVRRGYRSGNLAFEWHASASEFTIAKLDATSDVVLRFSQQAIPESIPIRMSVNAPFAGQTRPTYFAPDRDVIRGGEGADTILGNEDLDRVFGGSGTDIIIASPFETRNADANEVLSEQVAPSESNAKESRDIDPYVRFSIPRCAERSPARSIQTHRLPTTTLELTSRSSRAISLKSHPSLRTILNRRGRSSLMTLGATPMVLHWAAKGNGRA